MRLALLALPVSLAAACHPLACFSPAALPRDEPLILQSTDAWPREEVVVNVDTLGIPHIYGASELDVAYGLGVMHARDRLFQILLYVHAGEGRLTELLGEDLLEVDRQNRLLTHRLDEQLSALRPRDRDIIEAYCAGVNEGARMAGRSAEMHILGVDWEPLSPRNVLAIVRLQQWSQSVGLTEELARYRLVQAKGRDHPITQALLQDVGAGDVPIVTAEEHDGAAFAPPSSARLTVPPPASPCPGCQDPTDLRSDDRLAARSSDHRLQALKDDVAARFSRGGTGASNSWSVAPAHTAAGVAVLANDPHLDHTAPGVFYLADLRIAGDDGEEAIVAGGTFPGIPAVLIGHGNHIAWGITNAFADTQDLVVIQRQPGEDGYVVDGTTYAFGETLQRFKLGKQSDAPVHEEIWRNTIFGPLLPSGFGGFGGEPLVRDGEDLALLWTASHFPEGSSRFLSFWDLARSRTAEEATAALQDFSAPAMSVNMAFTDGTIAYRLSGIVPVRGDAQRVDFPRDGSSKSAGWVGRLPFDQKPQSTSPDKGYILASNQRIVDNGVLSQRFVGYEAARPWRAVRIQERLSGLLQNGDGPGATTEELLAIQQDTVAVDARALAPVLGRHCLAAAEAGAVAGHDDALVRSFCRAVRDFDGNFTKDAIALPYARFERELTRAVLAAHVEGRLVSDLAGQGFSQLALHEALLGEDAGAKQSALFDDPDTPRREGITGFAQRALRPAMDFVVDEAGGSESDWRWGKLHTLSLRGALARAPVVGFLFETEAQAESGTGNAPRAEASDHGQKMRITHGAGLRLIAEMTDPPTVRMIIDSGQSGHFGHRHLDDQLPLWSRGEPRALTMSRADSQRRREGAMVIAPRR